MRVSLCLFLNFLHYYTYYFISNTSSAIHIIFSKFSMFYPFNFSSTAATSKEEEVTIPAQDEDDDQVVVQDVVPNPATAISEYALFGLFNEKINDELKTKGYFFLDPYLQQALPHLGNNSYTYPFIKSEVAEYIIRHGRFLSSNIKCRRRNVVLPDDDPLARAFGKSQIKIDRINDLLIPKLTPKPIPPPHNHYSKQMVTPSPSLLPVLHAIPMLSSSCTSFPFDLIQLVIIDYVYKHGDVLCNETLLEGDYEVTLQHDDPMSIAMNKNKFTLSEVHLFLFNNTKVEEEHNDEHQADDERQADDELQTGDECQADEPAAKKAKMDELQYELIDSSPESWSTDEQTTDKSSSEEEEQSEEEQPPTPEQPDDQIVDQPTAKDDDSDSDSQTHSDFRPPLRMSYEQFEQIENIKSQYAKVNERLLERNKNLKDQLQKAEALLNDYRGKEKAQQTTPQDTPTSTTNQETPTEAQSPASSPTTIIID